MSLQAKLVKLLLPIQFRNWEGLDFAEQRARQQKGDRFVRLPAGTVTERIDVGGTTAEWITAPSAGSSVILYFHGGGYVLGLTAVHRAWLARLSQATGMRGLAVAYRLAPEHPFPAALDDALTAYRWLLAQGTAPEHILLGGDSAGGGLALALLVALRDAGEPLPAGAFCLSPWTDLALTGASMQSNAAKDPILSADLLGKYAAAYVNGRSPTDPLISPLYADLAGLPPLLIQVGDEETLLDDSTRFVAKARQAGVAATLDCYEGMFHVFPLFDFLPESKQVLARITQFGNNHSSK
ncbi:MAG: alpha/beta hydrolase [Candidatus Promineifilaceae bacterium]